MKNKNQPQYAIKRNAVLRNRMNNDLYYGDVINEENIDGKVFFVVRKEGKVFKLNKDSYVVQNR